MTTETTTETTTQEQGQEAVAAVESAPQGPEPGLFWKGLVREIGAEHVVVDLGGASGRFAAREAKGLDGSWMVSVGEEVEVLVDDLVGEVWAVSMEKAEKVRVYEKLQEMARKKEVVSGVVTRHERRGLSVDIGVKAILPAKDSGIRQHEMTDAIGERLQCQVVRFDEKKGEVVLSRKDLAKVEAQGKKAEALGRLQVGQRVKGVVTSLANYGAFVDLGGVDGLLHVSEIRWERTDKPEDVLSVGDEVEVQVLEIDTAKDRIALSRKVLLENPWSAFMREYPVGSKAKGVVSSLPEFGAFVRIGAVEGLIHISELSWERNVRRSSDVLSLDQEVEVQVVKVDAEKQRVGLSLKRLTTNPWEIALAELKEGDKVKGVVRSVADFGVFVEVVPGVEGLLHVSDMSWTRQVGRPRDLREFHEGDELEVRVLGIDAERQRISLGLKQLEADPWEAVGPELREGGTVTVTISRIVTFGAFATLAPGLEGLIHASELSAERVERIEDVVKVGQEVAVKVLSADRAKRKVALSLKAQVEAEGGAMRSYTEEGAVNEGLAAQLRAKGFQSSEGGEEAAQAEEPVQGEEPVQAEEPVQGE